MRACHCGHSFDPLAFANRIGTMNADGGVLLLANCPACGNTVAVTLIPHRDDVREKLDADSLLDDDATEVAA